MAISKADLQKSRDHTAGIVNLEFSDVVIAASQPEVNAIFDRIDRGVSTFEQEDAALMARWYMLKQNV